MILSDGMILLFAFIALIGPVVFLIFLNYIPRWGRNGANGGYGERVNRSRGPGSLSIAIRISASPPRSPVYSVSSVLSVPVRGLSKTDGAEKNRNRHCCRSRFGFSSVPYYLLNTESNCCPEEEKSSERVNLAASAAPNSRFMPQSSHSTESGPV